MSDSNFASSRTGSCDGVDGVLEGRLEGCGASLERRRVLVGDLATLDVAVDELRAHDRADRGEVVVADVREEDVEAPVRLVGAPRVAEARLGRHARDADDERVRRGGPGSTGPGSARGTRCP